MNTNEFFSPENCQILLDRLIDAETETKAALKKTDAGHPLAAAVQKLLDVHGEIRDQLREQFAAETEETPQAQITEKDVARAAIEIEREAHTGKADFKDVIKALFMWRDDPEERALSKQQQGS